MCGHDGSPDSQVLFFSFPPAGHSLDPNATPHVQSCHDATVMMMTEIWCVNIFIMTVLLLLQVRLPRSFATVLDARPVGSESL